MEINRNLISLKCVLFIFFAGLSCLFPFLPMHMLAVGLNLHEARIVSIVAPCVALLGPAIVAPLADKLAGNSKNSSGRYLRFMIAGTLVWAGIFYLLLMAVPTVVRFQARRPSVIFTSDASGGMILQERCMQENECYAWGSGKKGSLYLSNCRYVCNKPPEARTNTSEENLPNLYPDEDASEEGDSEYGNYDEGIAIESDFGLPDTEKTIKPQVMIEPPHLCYIDENDERICEVFVKNSKNISLNVTMLTAINIEEGDEWCRYPLGRNFTGRINPLLKKQLKQNNCQPIIQCNVEDPYDSPNSVLADSKCISEIGDAVHTFWSYLVVRSIADIFPTTALVLLDAAVIIATRETSTGRGDVGIQLAWGTIGFALFAPLVGFLTQDVMPPTPAYSIAIILFAILMFTAAGILIFADGMPLSPPEWWWHTKCGMLALPMSAVRRYGLETGALLLIIMILGIFWSALDSYLPWHLTDLSGSPVLIGLTITIGALPAVPVLWHAEKIVDYCGHSNLLITAFIFYIVRYTGLSYIEDPWWVLILEALEVFTLILMWITTILYFRHLIPRRFTVSGQALPVIAHFGFGRCMGAIIGSVVEHCSKQDSLRCMYRAMAIAAAVIATIYFLLYHFLLKPGCAAPTTGPPRSPPTVMQGMNGNGSYTPLRIYHNGRARKGQFRY